MPYEWVLDVLTDLRAFAQRNGLKALAEQLDDTSLVAAAEIAQRSEGLGRGQALDATKAGGLHRRAAAVKGA